MPFAIVDPYSSGSLLARELDHRGHPCIMVQSTAEIPGIFRSSYHPEDFREIIRHRDRPESTAALLRTRGVSAVVPGCEMGVELADHLAEQLGLPSNGTAYSAARRNKLLMAQTVAAHGLRIPDQYSSDQLTGLLDWARTHSRWPVIVKPVCSCASDNVHRCTSLMEVSTAFHRIMAQYNIFGEKNTEVLVQEYLVGTEYVVDTVSCAGHHRAAGYWRYRKPSGASFTCYDSMELLPYDGALQSRLFSFARGVLDALGVQYGPAHCELMWHDHSIALVEMATRLTAGNNAILSRICGATCQLDLTIDAYLNPTAFIDGIDEQQTLERRAVNVFLMPRKQGRLLALPGLPEIRRLRSLHRVSIGAEVGQPVPRVLGLVTLVHPDIRIIEEDVRRIRNLEDHGLYEIHGRVATAPERLPPSQLPRSRSGDPSVA